MERNITLDYFKLFLSFLVVLIHVHPLFDVWGQFSLYGWFLSNGISRIAVPCFFIINGYFLYNNISNIRKLITHLKRIIIIYIVWVSIYLYMSRVDNSTIWILSKQILFGYQHLWYVLILAESIIILYLLKKCKLSNSVLLILSVILFLTGYYIQNRILSLAPADYYISAAKYRNCLFFGLPFLSLGYLIKSYADQLPKIKDKYLFILIVISTVLLLLESYIGYEKGWRMDFFLSLIVLCPVLLVFVLKNSRYIANDDGFIGNLSAGVYYTHILAISLLVSLGANSDNFFKVPLVFFVSMLLSVVVIRLNKRIKIFL